MSAPVALTDYDPSWPAQFERERAAIADAIAQWLSGPLEHIGSTAIPGLQAKPVLDIMAPVVSLSASREALPLLAPLQYEYWPYRADVMHWLCKPSDEFRTHHLHLIPMGSRLWHERLAFRDYLRTHLSVASEYVDLKKQLAARHEYDREAYTDGKTEFVERIVALASENQTGHDANR